MYIIAVFFIVGCKQSELPKLSSKSNRTKTTKSQEDLEKEEAESLLKELRQKNPFRRDHASGAVADVKADTILKGIIWDTHSPYALVGDRVIIEGDYLDNKRVIKINKDSIVLDNNGEEEVIGLEGIYR